jgi:hypothetical protein
MSSSPEGCFKKPYRFIPSNSEASLTGHEMEVPRLTPRNDMKGETPRLAPRGDIPYPVVPRHASAEGSHASFGATKREARGDKERGSG